MSVSSEVGRLRTVLLHRPGPELQRLTPRNNDKLLFDGIPWVSRAQEEHDAFADALRGHDVEVLYLTDLLAETLGSEDARAHAIRGVTASLRLGDTLRDYLRGHLSELSPEDLTDVLTAGLRNDEVRGGFGLVTSLLGSDDFLIDPLAQPLVHPRLERLDQRPGGGHLAGDAGPRARDTADRADLQPAPTLRRCREDPRLASRAHRGRRRTAARPGRACRRRRGAYDARRGRATGPAGVRRRGGAHRARRPHRAGAGDDAPRHGLHDGRRRQDRDVPQRGRPPDRPRRHTGERTAA